jgi:hypothetical protein
MQFQKMISAAVRTESLACPEPAGCDRQLGLSGRFQQVQSWLLHEK